MATKQQEPMQRRKVFKRGYVFRSAITGRFVSRLFALFNPSSTVCEKVER